MAREIMDEVQAKLDRELDDLTIDQELAKAQTYATLAVASELARINDNGLRVETFSNLGSKFLG